MDWSKLDFATILYLLALLSSLYGVCLFGWWWIKNGSASFAFGFVTAVFFGQVVERSIGLYTRFLLYTSEAKYDAFILSPYFGGRIIVSVIATFAIVIYMTTRVYKGVHKKYQNTKLKRRRTDKIER
jgi:hypothetical protein